MCVIRFLSVVIECVLIVMLGSGSLCVLKVVCMWLNGVVLCGGIV